MTDDEDIAGRHALAANKLAKWRSVFAGWQLGTRPSDDGETRAVRDHREVTMMLRAELNGITRVLLDKGIVTREELAEIWIEEYEYLDAQYEKTFPGFKSTQGGMEMKLPEAGETMKRLGFPP